jgi:hypothetical protein
METKELKKRLSKTVFYSTFSAAKTNKLALFLTMIIDVAFVLSLLALNKILEGVFPGAEGVIVNAGTTVAVLFLSLALYLLLVFMLYSLLKFLIMSRISRIADRKELQWGLFGRWCIANSFVIGLYALLFLVFSAVFIISVRVQFIEAVRNFFLVLIGFFYYLSVNTMHSLFCQGMHRPGKAFRKAMDLVFNRLKIYVGLVVSTAVIFLLLSLVYYMFDWAVLLVLGKAIQDNTIYSVYAIVNTIIISIFGLGLLAFNRVYFYEIVKNRKAAKASAKR